MSDHPPSPLPATALGAPPAAPRSRLVLLLILLALAANVVALLLPLVDITALVKRRTVGLTNSASLLWRHQLHVLAILALLLSVVFPPLKLAVLAWAWWGRGATRAQRRALWLVEALGKWSLFDVLLMVLLIGLTRGQFAVAVAPCAGLAAFTGSVVVAMLAGELLSRGCAGFLALPRPRPQAPTVLLVALAALPAGAALLLPVLGLHDWRLLPCDLSITDMVTAAWAAGAYALAACCALSLAIFPLVALANDALAAAGATRRRPWLARWSMLDVLALALVVFALEGGSYVTTDLCLGAAVLAIAIAGRWLLAWWVRRAGPAD
ncbi:MAG: paraquat-inducible protein A [Planctomycetes bacterium]|nr:paraquat-inducible protein A [Planctomycetota bacterium]